MMPLKSQSQGCPEVTKACGEALESADAVIQKQGDLIEFLYVRTEDLFKERTDMQLMLEESQTKIEKAQRNTIWFTVTAALLGSLATVVVLNQTK